VGLPMVMIVVHIGSLRADDRGPGVLHSRRRLCNQNGYRLGWPYVYFLTAANLGGVMGSVGRVLKTGGMTDTIANSVAGPVFAAVDGKDAYWLSFGDTALRGALWRAPIGGGPTTKLVETPGVLFSGLVLDDEAVFWARDWQLDTPPEDGVSALRLCK
jgi:hypothetical protein